ncbi:hypothetical protein B0A52_06843 [Exophiala mesophila]|uniref:Zn(2)-C6 fungal-type domain-containing protein n=1 Tax=Exophiala mesophila TaxID=212818 RepID=A0A438N095_EXOME|nr:hypothetical protein B0A52_06843 [Exophiala mesophila]
MTPSPEAPVKKPPRTRERKPRGRGLRTRTGCITCRKRHLKCNEEKPICGPCVRSNQTCVYADPTAPKPSPSISSSTSNVTSRLSSALEVLPSSVNPQSPTSSSRRGSVASFDLALRPPWGLLRSWNDDAYNSLARTNSWERPGSHTPAPSATSHPLTIQPKVETDAYGQSMNFVPWVTAPEPSALSSPLQYNALMPHQLPMHNIMAANTAYSDTSSDDLPMTTRLPDSGPAREAVIAKWFGIPKSEHESELANSTLPRPDRPPLADTLHPHLQAGAGSGTTYTVFHSADAGLTNTSHQSARALGKSTAPPWRSVEPLKLKRHEVDLFNYFVKHFTSRLDLFNPQHMFSNQVPHLAMHNVGILNAILAISLCHKSGSLSKTSTEQRTPKEAYHYYHETLQYLQTAMQYESYHSSDEVYATCLIIASYEMLNGSRLDWDRHLQGFKYLQESQGINGESTGLKQAVWWIWLRQDMWAALREKRKPFSNWRPTKGYDQLTPHEMAQRSVSLMARVVSYCSQEEIDKGHSDIVARAAKGDSLLRALDDWHRHLPMQFNPLPSNEEPGSVFRRIWYHPPAFGPAIQIVCAARILLLRHRPCVSGYDDLVQQQAQQAIVQRCAETICGVGSVLVDDDSVPASSQSGLCIQAPRERSEIVRLLKQHRHTLGWPVKPLSDDLQMIWNGLSKSPLP